MVPFDRYLLAVMAMPLSLERRFSLLARCNCHGLSKAGMAALAKGLLHSRGDRPWGDAFCLHLEKTAEGEHSESYDGTQALAFVMQQGVEPLYRALTDNVASPFQKALQLMTRRIQYRFVSALFLANQDPSRVAAAFNKRFSVEISEDVFHVLAWAFFRYEAMSEQQIMNWIGCHEPMLAQPLRLAMYAPAYEIYDMLGAVSPDLDLRHISSRIMARSLSKFERLSQIQHYRASSEARQWGNMALAAAERYEKVKGGEYVDFLAKFQIALMEADPSVVEAHVPSETE